MITQSMILFTYRSGEGEPVLLFATGLTLMLTAGGLGVEPLFEFFLLVSRSFAGLV